VSVLVSALHGQEAFKLYKMKRDEKKDVNYGKIIRYETKNEWRNQEGDKKHTHNNGREIEEKRREEKRRDSYLLL
jgi:hypothetical protein